jgi:RNA polymerase sigma-70 factor (ECF subfamily)
MTFDEDEALVERFKAGDPHAFDDLVRKYQRPLFYLARRYVKDDDEAKDLAQRAFVKAFQGVSRLRGAGAFKTWLYKIVSNLALNHIRDHARLTHDEEAGVSVPVDAVGTDRMEASQDKARMLAAIDELPPKQRMVLELRVFEGLSFREVARAVGSTENAAKVNFHHAVRRLRENVGGTKP